MKKLNIQTLDIAAAANYPNPSNHNLSSLDHIVSTCVICYCPLFHWKLSSWSLLLGSILSLAMKVSVSHHRLNHEEKCVSRLVPHRSRDWNKVGDLTSSPSWWTNVHGHLFLISPWWIMRPSFCRVLFLLIASWWGIKVPFSFSTIPFSFVIETLPVSLPISRDLRPYFSPSWSRPSPLSSQSPGSLWINQWRWKKRVLEGFASCWKMHYRLYSRNILTSFYQ